MATAQAATIVWSGAIDNGLTLADGSTMLPVNSLVRLGYFDISDSLIQQNATNLAFLESNFHQLDFDRVGGPEVQGAAGYFSEIQTGLDTSSTGLNIAGKQLVIWAFASSDNTSLAQSVATATQTGIFYMALGSNGRWAVPNENDPLGNTTTIDLTDLTGDGPSAGLLSGAKVLAGNFTESTAGIKASRNFALQVVPEPATAGLALVGGAAMLLRRRRRA